MAAPIHSSLLHAMSPALPSAAHDFDFLHGDWAVRQRRLKHRLQGCTDWEEFDGISRARPLPGGIGNHDSLVAEAWRPGWMGMTTRFYNPVTGLWSLYWATNDGSSMAAATGLLAPPVVGRFDGDIGLFEGDDQFDGRPIRVRFRWTRRGPDAARWEQAFSADGGLSWEWNWSMDFERLHPGDAAASVAPPDLGDGLLELRQYTLHPGQREALIGLFDREFVESQEACGMAVPGQFRDLDDADRFVWLRGFAEPARRAEALAAFYEGPVWQRHRDAANATMRTWDDVCLLRPAWPGAGLHMAGRQRPAGPLRQALPGLLEVGLLPLDQAAPPDLLQACRERLPQALAGSAAAVLGCYVSETGPNLYPRLPLRQGPPLLVVFTLFETAAAHAAQRDGGPWQQAWQPLIQRWAAGPVQWLRLVATARSALHA